MFPSYDFCLKDFKKGVRSFADEINLPFNNFSFEDRSGPEFAYYSVEYEKNEYYIGFYVSWDWDIEKRSVENIIYSLQLNFPDTPAHFHFFNKTDKNENPPVLERWLSFCLSEINVSQQDPFEYYFHDGSYKNFGYEGYSDPTAYFFKIALSGILSAREDRIWVVRIRHIREDDLYRSFSYAILPDSRVDWLIFPDAVGLDSGGGRRGYEEIEACIDEAKKRADIRIIDIDASKEEFKKRFEFLYPGLSEEPAKSPLYEKVMHMISEREKVQIFLMEIQDIDGQINKQEHMRALRGMRALIEGLCKEICRINGFKIPENPKIPNLSGTLISNKIIDGHMRSWFDAFYSIANEAAHNVDSGNIIDPRPEMRNGVFNTTIEIGNLLILQLITKI